MSVRKSDRSEGKLQVLESAKQLAAYAITILKSEKVFPKNQRWIMAAPMATIVREILGDVRCANSIYLTDGCGMTDDYRKRHGYQVDAHCKVNEFLGLVDLSYEVYKIDSRVAEHLTELATTTNDLLKRWMRSDQERCISK